MPIVSNGADHHGLDESAERMNEQRAITVCVCGAGIMGSAYMKALQHYGPKLRLYNRTREKLAPFEAVGARVLPTPAEAAETADVIITSVSDDDAAREVWFGDTGILARVKRGAVAVEMSTVSATHVEEWARRVWDAGVLPLDCPVTGSRTGAESGTLYAFVGGSDEAFNKAWPVLQHLCSDVHRFGPAGSGMRFKLVYNLLGAGIGAVFAEALALAEEAGLDPAEVCDVIKDVGWGSAVARSKGDAMARRDHDDVHYRIALFYKDLQYAMKMVRDHDCAFLCSSAVVETYGYAAESTMRDKDISAVREAVMKTRQP